MFSSISTLKRLSLPNLVFFKMAFVQLFILSLVALGLIFNYHFQIVLNFFMGGLVSIVPALLFGQFCFNKVSTKTPKSFLNAVYFGEILKFFLTALLFGIVFLQKNLLAIWIFLGYITALFIYVLLLIRLNNAEKPLPKLS